MSEQDAKELLGLCKAAADGLRQDILRVLRADSYGVNELGQILDMPQPGMSHHLKILHRAGLVDQRREGNCIFYRRALPDHRDQFASYRHSLLECLDRLPLETRLQDRIRDVQQARARHSRAYFAKHSGRFRQDQEQIADFEQYKECLVDLLDNLQLEPDLSVMEVGPGEGDLLRLLAQRFRRVHALDNSVDMLERARSRLQDLAIDYILSDLACGDAAARPVDLLVMNMVLHHLPSPAAAFLQAGRLLNSRGLLLIGDLCPHDQDWVRPSCGDLWLGLDPADLDRWAKDAGFSRLHGVYLGLRNGFQIQLGVFRKDSPAKLNSDGPVNTAPQQGE